MAKPKPPQRTTSGRTRCAIYTRKSTEEGLEQAFNSLDAQREACAAYILSQRHEGWTLAPDLYDDGGFSGGTMERPGLKQPMTDVASGKVDVIVVYKVDRLTRSLADFAKIVEVLDGAGASFVSVTQAFNTTTSMGRLTLNVLLSFAQFEREVTGERIRDKVAASKRKGMWMGGNVPLGYDVRDRKLVINHSEADTVRHIYRRYLEAGSISELAIELEQQGIRSKPRAMGNGADLGSRTLSRGAVAHILKNHLYVAEITHHGEVFAGEHQPIVDRETWEKVQAMIAFNCTNGDAKCRDSRNLLVGRISDGEGRAMTPSHANKDGRRYRYYVTRPHRTGEATENAWRVPAGEIEQLVLNGVTDFLRAANTIFRLAAENGSDQSPPVVVTTAAALAQSLENASSRATAIAELELSIQVGEQQVTIEMSLEALLGADIRHTINVPARLVRRGYELRLAYPPADQRAPSEPDVKLVGLIAKAEAAHRELTADSEIDVGKNRRAHLMRLARLRYLAPDIISAILAGRHPVELSARKLLRAETIPLNWQEQRRVFGFA